LGAADDFNADYRLQSAKCKVKFKIKKEKRKQTLARLGKITIKNAKWVLLFSVGEGSYEKAFSFLDRFDSWYFPHFQPKQSSLSRRAV
jgi:hypothetical protein